LASVFISYENVIDFSGVFKYAQNLLMKLLITGSSGFIGKHLVSAFQEKYKLKIVYLQKKKVEALDLNGIQVIIHLAGKAHQMRKIDPKIYFEINRDLTIKLAKKAKAEGVQQFVFISTVKVYGDIGKNKDILDEYSTCNPIDPYGQSKLGAERELIKLETANFKIVIIRPPLVYGAGVKGNLERLIPLVKKISILPFGGINNKRSMVYVGNLIALINHIIQNRSRGIFIAGDQEPHSTTELVKLIKKHLKSRTILIKLPLLAISLLRVLKPALVNRLFDSYVIDNSITNKKLGFKPPFSFELGIKEMVEAFVKNKK